VAVIQSDASIWSIVAVIQSDASIWSIVAVIQSDASIWSIVTAKLYSLYSLYFLFLPSFFVGFVFIKQSVATMTRGPPNWKHSDASTQNSISSQRLSPNPMPLNTTTIFSSMRRHTASFSTCSESSFPRDESCFETQDQSQSVIVSTVTAPTATSTTSKKRKREQGVEQGVDSSGYKFACPFGIFNPNKFRPHSGPGSHKRFDSCQGSGWRNIRHLP
jgi:hypothetical protein